VKHLLEMVEAGADLGLDWIECLVTGPTPQQVQAQVVACAAADGFHFSREAQEDLAVVVSESGPLPFRRAGTLWQSILSHQGSRVERMIAANQLGDVKRTRHVLMSDLQSLLPTPPPPPGPPSSQKASSAAPIRKRVVKRAVAPKQVRLSDKAIDELLVSLRRGRVNAHFVYFFF
jgi:hypothetical protein